MKRKITARARSRRALSRISPLLAISQSAPVRQFLVRETCQFGVSQTARLAQWSIAVVSGLGAFDSVSGATLVKQIAPSAGSGTVPATSGSALNFIVQVTGAPSTAKSWKLTGTLPTGLTHNSAKNSNTDSVTGIPRQTGNFPVTITAYENSGFSGGSKSASFTISVKAGASPPTIASQPASTSIAAGKSATLSVASPGATSFQWYSGNSGDTTTPVAGAVAASFTTPVLLDTHSYWVRAINSAGNVNSATAVVTVIIPPGISTQPVSAAADAGTVVTLSVEASGTAPTYQWYEGNSRDTTHPVSGAVQAAFSTPALAATVSYWVRVTNSAGSVDSAAATLTVTDTFATWESTRFSAEQLADTTISGPDMDPDHDGVPNQQEFIWGTSPLTPDAPDPLSITMNGGGASLSFNARAASGPGYSGLVRHFALESAGDLAGAPAWSAVSGFSDIAGQGQEVTTPAAVTSASLFYHLKAWLDKQ